MIEPGSQQGVWEPAQRASNEPGSQQGAREAEVREPARREVVLKESAKC